jgi:hypothetical protein
MIEGARNVSQFAENISVQMLQMLSPLIYEDPESPIQHNLAIRSKYITPHISFTPSSTLPLHETAAAMHMPDPSFILSCVGDTEASASASFGFSVTGIDERLPLAHLASASAGWSPVSDLLEEAEGSGRTKLSSRQEVGRQ